MNRLFPSRARFGVRKLKFLFSTEKQQKMIKKTSSRYRLYRSLYRYRVGEALTIFFSLKDIHKYMRKRSDDYMHCVIDEANENCGLMNIYLRRRIVFRYSWL